MTVLFACISAHELIPKGKGGRPLSPLVTVCLGLNMIAGGHFQRVGAAVGGMTQSVACRALNRNVL